MVWDHRSGVRPLDGVWQATPADDEARRSALQASTTSLDWPTVSMPGHWRDEPDFDSHDGAVLYRHVFDLPTESVPPSSDRTWLVADGVVAQSELWMNGAYLGPTDACYTPHSFEVTSIVADGGALDLVMEVACPTPSDRSAKRLLTGCLQDSDIISTGWNPGGVAVVPRLEWTGPVRIDRLRVVCVEADADRAVLAVDAVLLSDEPRQVWVTTLVDSAADEPGAGAAAHSRMGVDLAAGSNDVQWRVAIESPALWWPRHLGDQPLYDVRCDVVVDGETSHVRKRRTGLRHIDFSDWIMRVNGTPLFLKGVMLHPSDRSIGKISAEQIDADLALAVDANVDLVRLATHVARPELYRRADELGLLIWQDLPMTRGMHRSSRGPAAQQAVDLVDKLGHHPSIAIWCAHDDPTGRPAGADILADPKGFRRWKRRQLIAQELPSWNRSVLDRTVARAFRNADPSRPVIPHSGVLPHPPLSEGTDAELWLGWERGDERDLVTLGRRIPGLLRFVSGIGAQSVPETDWILDPDAWPELDWERLSLHHGLRKVQLDRRVPAAEHETFDEWQHATQRSHADVVRRHVEQLRIRKYRPTGGFIVETLIDPQHAISTALVDHARVPKAAYAALVNACKPVIVAADPMPADVQPGEELTLDVYVVNDERHPLDAEVTALIEGPGGPVRWRWTGEVAADEVAKVGRLAHRIGAGAGELSLTLSVTGPGVSHSTRETATVTAL